ncbi:MAG: hypothetical protein ABWK15_06690 [Dissulfuribacterales bacterium]
MGLVLITSLGTGPNAKDLILQFIDFFCKTLFYNTHGREIKTAFHGFRLTDIYLITTTEASDSFKALQKDIEYEVSQGLFDSPPPNLHEISLGIEDVATFDDEEKARSIIHNKIQEISSHTDLIIASGGRKNMTQILVEAGMVYGCKGYLSITAPRGKERRDCTLDFNISWFPLKKMLESKQGFSDLHPETLSENFRSLYILPLSYIKRLQNSYIGREPLKASTELEWLKLLPKAELHCHLGGEVQPSLLKKIASHIEEEEALPLALAVQALYQSVFGRKPDEHANNDDGPIKIVSSLVQRMMGYEIPLKDYSKFLGDAAQISGLKPYQINACFISCCTEDQLNGLMWQGCQNNPISLEQYMAIGNLGGSSLLQTASAIRMTLEHLLKGAVEENVRYIEVRCSPENYTEGGLSAEQVMDILFQTAEDFCVNHGQIKVNFIIMATRHKDLELVKRHVNLAVAFAREQMGGKMGKPRVCGFDLAGDEEFRDFSEFRALLKPLHDSFVQITIHAGEVGADYRIRDAIHELSARRIGHGLKLVHNPLMMDYVRDAGIAVEMCPTSNSQTNGYRDFSTEGDSSTLTALGPEYPLKRYLHHGIEVTINTDNRGISRTTLSHEFLKAAQMTPGGLSRWEVLQLVKNGFKAAFLPLDEKNRLLREVDKEIFGIVLEEMG